MMEPGYQACIFDLDGTLADTLRSIAAIGNGALQALGYPTLETDRYRMLVGNGADTLIRRMLHAVGGPSDEAACARLRAEYDRRYAADPLGQVTAYPGLPELLGRLKEKGIRIGVLSNKPHDMTQVIVAALYGTVPDRVWGQRPGVPKKPDPTAALALAAELAASPARCLYVGDSGVDMDTARNAGMDSCGVLWGFRDEEELQSHGARHLAADAGALGALLGLGTGA